MAAEVAAAAALGIDVAELRLDRGGRTVSPASRPAGTCPSSSPSRRSLTTGRACPVRRFGQVCSPRVDLPPNPNRADLPAQQPPPPIPIAHGAATNRRSLSPTTQVNLPNSTQLPNPTTAAEAAAPAAGDRCSAPPSSSQAPASAGRRWPRRSTAVASWLSDSASSPPKVRLLIGGEFVKSRDNEHVDVTNPATQEVMSWIPLTTADEFKASVDAARTAFPGQWNTLVTTWQRIMFKYQELIWANMDKLAENITTE
ncbi:hypothetical protein E2562_009628 [Oryza meyeriana var. granulata]|uniref:Aldehyde dehydrogenase domain-containing protein n=1 Tax=Oryza meyeriana var. granulata TaxID=110450 RepID=A0A6G1BJE5_9ORYZ|nr:hypothetical protein E2562_009628 [Oryza meyeriana var. granulata]